MGGVGINDAADQPVTDNIRRGKRVDIDAFDIRQDLQGVLEARWLAARQIHLARIARNHHAAVTAQPRQHHLHLRHGCVLRFIHDDEGILQRTSTHEGERRNFNLAARHAALHLFLSHQLAQRVPDRQHVGINFFFQRPRQEAELLARLNGRPGHDQALAQARREFCNACRDGEECLACAGRADAKDEFGAIEAGAGEIHAAVGRTAGLLDEGQGSLARLQSAWVGDGSMSYQAVQQRWDANSNELNMALQSLAQAISNAGSTMGTTEAGVIGTFS